jgi:hypothetical protein
VVFGRGEEKGEGFVNSRKSLKLKANYRLLPVDTFSGIIQVIPPSGE